MKILRDKQINDLKTEIKESAIKETRADIFKNVSNNIPSKGNAFAKILAEQLERINKNIDSWENAVDAAEDIDNPDRQELIEMYKDFIDDYQLWSVMQSRKTKSTSGSFKIMDEEGEIDEEETKKFLDPQGLPLPWFRNFMKLVVDSKFYGWEAIQLGDVLDNKFVSIDKIPEENTIPYYDAMIKDTNQAFSKSSDNVIYFIGKDNTEDFDTWVIRTGSKTDLGLINKCAKYIIYKKVFGNWSQHASIFGMPLRVGTTDMNDPLRKGNMQNAFIEQEGATWIIKDLLDEIEFLQQSGTDPHQIYGVLIDKCDSAISKIVLSQTGTTDEKAYSGSAGVHALTEADVIYSDKLDIKAVVNEMLIPRMKKIGMISDSKKIFGGWDNSEKLTIQEWATVIAQLSQAGFAVDSEDVEKHTTIKVDTTIVSTPENKSISIMNKIESLYGKNNS